MLSAAISVVHSSFMNRRIAASCWHALHMDKQAMNRNNRYKTYVLGANKPVVLRSQDNKPSATIENGLAMEKPLSLRMGSKRNVIGNTIIPITSIAKNQTNVCMIPL